MSGNCDNSNLEYLEEESPTKEDYKLILIKGESENFLRFLIMSLFWRYEFD